MNYPNFFEPKDSLSLFGLDKEFNFISNLYLQKKLPKVLMFSGNKGSGKSTLINHFLYSIFDNDNYDFKKFTLSDSSHFLKQYKNNIFSNIIYLQGANFKSIKIDDIRDLKDKILKSNISGKDRFIVFDDIELFNNNSLNALLKIIEEPSTKNYFFLINNKSRPLLETIKSRSLEIKVNLNEYQRIEIIKKLTSLHKLELTLDPENSKLTPGNFVYFNYICNEHNIKPSNDFATNLSLLLSLYKKNKNIIYINLIFFLADFYLLYLRKKKLIKNYKLFEIRNFVLDNLNNFVHLNINQNSLINAVSKKLNYE